MKIKYITNSLLSMLAVCALASCADNDVYNPDKAKDTGSLKVPASFDWSTTRTTTCSITSPVNTRVSIYSDKECKDNQLLAETQISKDAAAEVNLDLPAACEAYYVKYPTENGSNVLEVRVQTNTRAADTSLTLPENASEYGGDDSKGTSLIYIPAKDTYGTIMFEDLYPEKGDYDFNDFVAGYNVCTEISRGSFDYFYDCVTIKLQIRAIGGTKPYRLGIELTPLLKKYVDGNYTIESSTNDVSLELISKNDNDPTVFVVTGTNSLKEGGFYNTVEPSTKGMPEIVCTIKRDNYKDDKAAMQFVQLNNSTNINFFLQNTNTGEEIHLKGYGVTKYATNSDTKFYTDDNFVWGMKIPAIIPHATEKTDFIEAYPKFASWVTSGGTNDSDWYKTYNSSKVIQ